MRSVTIKCLHGEKLLRVWVNKKNQVWLEYLDSLSGVTAIVKRNNGERITIRPKNKEIK